MRILLADGDGSRSKGLGSALAEAGHVVDRAEHGPAALEVALERAPKVVICALELPVIDGARLAEILRGNPRTRGARFVFLVEHELDAPLSIHLEDQVVVAPWPEGEVLRALGGEPRASEAEEPSGVEGNLEQLALADLLQMFHLGRKTGKLRVMPRGEAVSGTIELDTGQIAAASLDLGGGGAIEGEKALYRMMGVRQGRFAFARGAVGGEVRITRPTRELLLEAARQLDEWERVARLLPHLDARLVLARPLDPEPGDDHPLVREVATAIEKHGRLRDILDRCAIADAQVARVIQRLIEERAVEVEAPGAEASDGDGIFAQGQVRRLREWLSAATSRPSGVLKVPVVPVDPGALENFITLLREVPGFHRPDPAPARGNGLGTLGRFPAGPGIDVWLIAVPPGAVYEPVWEVVAHGMLGALVLLRTSVSAALLPIERVVRVFRRASDRPIVPVIESTGTAPTLGEVERREIERLGDGPLLALSSDADPASDGSASVLQNLFARLVP